MQLGLKMSGYGGNVPGDVGDTLHCTTREGEQEADATRRDSLGVVFRNWYPGPARDSTAVLPLPLSMVSAVALLGSGVGKS